MFAKYWLNREPINDPYFIYSLSTDDSLKFRGMKFILDQFRMIPNSENVDWLKAGLNRIDIERSVDGKVSTDTAYFGRVLAPLLTGDIQSASSICLGVEMLHPTTTDMFKKFGTQLKDQGMNLESIQTLIRLFFLTL